MKPIAKYSALAGALAWAVAAVARRRSVAVVDTEFIKAEAAKAVRERTGRELTFAGATCACPSSWPGGGHGAWPCPTPRASRRNP
jgi:hypothetical protein